MYEINSNEAVYFGKGSRNNIPDILKRKGDELYSGSYVVGGTAKVQVTEVGKSNYIEKIQAKARKFKRPKSEILKTINKIFGFISIVVVVLGTATIATNIIKGNFWANALTFSGSMIAMIPSGLYLLTSIALTLAVGSLAKRQAQVQDFYAVEMLARVDLLCVDKTGTVTDGTMSVKKVIPLGTEDEEAIGQLISNYLNATKDTNYTAVALTKHFDILPNWLFS